MVLIKRRIRRIFAAILKYASVSSPMKATFVRRWLKWFHHQNRWTNSLIAGVNLLGKAFDFVYSSYLLRAKRHQVPWHMQARWWPIWGLMYIPDRHWMDSVVAHSVGCACQMTHSNMFLWTKDWLLSFWFVLRVQCVYWRRPVSYGQLYLR